MWSSGYSLGDVINVPETPSSVQVWFKFGLNRLKSKCGQIRLRTAGTEKLKYGPVQIIINVSRKGCTFYL
jgi:hypothetical protein